MDMFCAYSTEVCDPVDPDHNRIVAEAVVKYLRSRDYAGDAGEGIGDILVDEISCAVDPNCGGPGAPETVYEWIRLNYVDHMNESTYEATQKLRGDYYEALGKDISNMVAFTIPSKLMAKMVNEPLAIVETDEWKQNAYDAVLASFDKFDGERFLNEVN